MASSGIRPILQLKHCVRRSEPSAHQRGQRTKIWLVSFMKYDLGFFDQEAGRVRNAARKTPSVARVLPMSSEI